MIELIEHGYTRFSKQCENCGCQFKYDLSDIVDGGVICPDCNVKVSHRTYYDDPSLEENESKIGLNKKFALLNNKR